MTRSVRRAIPIRPSNRHTLIESAVMPRHIWVRSRHERVANCRPPVHNRERRARRASPVRPHRYHSLDENSRTPFHKKRMMVRRAAPIRPRSRHILLSNGRANSPIGSSRSNINKVRRAMPIRPKNRHPQRSGVVMI